MTESLTEALAYYDSWLAFNQRYQRVPGIQVAVYAGDAIAFSAAYGLADVENDVPLTEQHLFRIASHSKTFTATAVFQLVEQGRLRLDDKAEQHVTEIVGTPLGQRTVRELLAHAGGVTRDGLDADWWQLSTSFPDRDELLAVLRNESSAVIPENDRFKYSNIGYGLLGLVIEAASGTPYNTYVQTAIVDKLGLTGLGPELDPARLTEYAAGYSALAYADTRVPIEHIDTRALASATGFFGNARDLVTYFSAHLPGDDRLLSDKSKREMQHPLWTTGADDKARYGLGIAVTKVGDVDVFGHGGGYPGHITRTLVDPERRLVVSALTNAIDGPAAQLAEGLLRLLNLADSKDRVEEAGLGRFTGRFANLWGITDFVLLGGRLYATDPSGPNPAEEPQELEADGDTLRVTGGNGYGSYGESYRFAFDADGAVESVRGSSGLTMRPIDKFTLSERVTVAK
ncbi:CubicO group peptidase (beta-lactamase class C family) [Kribbella rubisoli]|uniref:CubicO group peptidase (Beta-lactamase class C family) n=1 Tax=Kribbella rubisoli TaxID=3075929 RepID=A0A4Q7XAT0_9ACTN|nr:serine hydrolase domain-containing protein [Kribbella rubisoli]RZU20307.1 CubicO group peptidase (beta-lactamase class C family) [Kribbella rubisoli]